MSRKKYRIGFRVSGRSAIDRAWIGGHAAEFIPALTEAGLDFRRLPDVFHQGPVAGEAPVRIVIGRIGLVLLPILVHHSFQIRHLLYNKTAPRS